MRSRTPKWSSAKTNRTLSFRIDRDPVTGGLSFLFESDALRAEIMSMRCVRNISNGGLLRFLQ